MRRLLGLALAGALALAGVAALAEGPGKTIATGLGQIVAPVGSASVQANLLAVGPTNTGAYSIDGTNWVSFSMPAGTWYGLAHSSSGTVAVGLSGAVAFASGLSPNFALKPALTIGGISQVDMYDVKWVSALSQFVATVDVGAGTPNPSAYIFRGAADASSWTAENIGLAIGPDNLFGFGAATSRYVVVGEDNQNGFATGRAATNPTLATMPAGSWSNRPTIGTTRWRALAVNGAKVVAVGFTFPTSATTSSAFSSDSGDTWSNVAVPSGIWRHVAYGNGIWVAMGDSAACTFTTDNVTWNACATPPAASVAAITYSTRFSKFYGLSTNFCTTSTDGSHWSTCTIPNGLYRAVLQIN